MTVHMERDYRPRQAPAIIVQQEQGVDERVRQAGLVAHRVRVGDVKSLSG